MNVSRGLDTIKALYYSMVVKYVPILFLPKPVGSFLGCKSQALGHQQQQAPALCPLPVPAPPAFPGDLVCLSSSHRGTASPGLGELGRVTAGTGGEKGF